MKRYILNIVLLFLVIPGLSFAQSQPVLRLTHLINMPDTAYEGVSYNNIAAVVSNVSNHPFQGSLSIAYSADSTNTAGYLYFNSAGTFIPAGGSTTLQINNFHFSPQYFRASDNIVVVWPVGNFHVMDSLLTQVHFIPVNAVGVQELVIPSVVVWPNPSSSFINIDYVGNNKIERVRIVDLAGKRIWDQIPESGRLILSDLKKGLYILEIRFSDGLIHRQKLIHNGN